LDNLNCADGHTPDYASEAYQSEAGELRDLCEGSLAHAQTAHPIATSTGKRGRPKQSMIRRLLTCGDDVWRLMTQSHSPFTNNFAEHEVRNHKVKQKVSGCFRTTQARDNYRTIRSYCATMIKQGANIYESLVVAFHGSTPSAALWLNPPTPPTALRGLSSYQLLS
jgi:transposase